MILFLLLLDLLLLILLLLYDQYCCYLHVGSLLQLELAVPTIIELREEEPTWLRVLILVQEIWWM